MSLHDEAQKARDVLAGAEQVAILLPASPSLDALAAAEVLARTLAGQNKYVGLPGGKPVGVSLPPEDFPHLTSPRPLIRERIVAIDTTHTPIGQLRYEKHDGEIEIVLSPKSGAISADAFSFRDGKIQCDALIAIAVPDIEAVPVEALGLTPQFFTETPIINIGNTEGHRDYGEVNLLAPEGAALSEIAAVCIKSIDDKALDADAATVLLAGIIHESRNFTGPVRIGTHLTAAELLEHGAGQARAAALAGADKPFSLLQLIARASVRSKETEGGRILWSFLTAEDFEKTGRTPQDATAVIEALPRFFPPHETSVLLWQSPGTREIRSLIVAPPAVLAALALREPGVLGNPVFALQAVFLNFLEAEERIAALLVPLLTLPRA